MEPRVGWRVWNVVESDGELRLNSLLYARIWEPSAEAVATCRRSLAYLPWGRMPLHLAPAVDCVCGVYGAARPEQARPFLAMAGADSVVYRILGSVALWGRVVEARFGWRAEYAYPTALYVPAKSQYARTGWRRRRLAATEVERELVAYGVPVDVTNVLPVTRPHAPSPHARARA